MVKIKDESLLGACRAAEGGGLQIIQWLSLTKPIIKIYINKMKQNEDNLEFLMNQFMREVFSKGYDTYRAMKDKKQEEAKSPLDDLSDMFEKFKQRYTNEYAEEVTPVNETEDAQTGSARALEVKYLKMQVAQLQQQLSDKDDIIAMLKEQQKKSKKKKASS